MTTIDDSTRNILATITAQQAACCNNTPAWEQVSAPANTTLPRQSAAFSGSQTKKKPETKKSKKDDDFKELNITGIYTSGGRAT